MSTWVMGTVFFLIMGIAMILAAVYAWKHPETVKNQSISKEKWEKEYKKNLKNLIICGAMFCLFGLACLWIENGGLSSSSTTNTRTCKSCDRTFSDSENTMSIAKTGMCVNCYSNFNWGRKYSGK